MIKTKSVYSPIDHAGDGLRILATRYRGRALPKTRYHVWMANLAPSEELLHAGQNEDIRWKVFEKRYRKELRAFSDFDAKNPLIKNHGQKFTLRLLQHLGKKQTITLMCHCDEAQTQCHRHILKKILDGEIR